MFTAWSSTQAPPLKMALSSCSLSLSSFVSPYYLPYYSY